MPTVTKRNFTRPQSPTSTSASGSGSSGPTSSPLASRSSLSRLRLAHSSCFFSCSCRYSLYLIANESSNHRFERRTSPWDGRNLSRERGRREGEEEKGGTHARKGRFALQVGDTTYHASIFKHSITHQGFEGDGGGEGLTSCWTPSRWDPSGLAPATPARSFSWQSLLGSITKTWWSRTIATASPSRPKGPW